MPATTELTVRIADLPQLKAIITDAIAAAVEAERRRFATLVRATCACQQCKGDVEQLLKGD